MSNHNALELTETYWQAIIRNNASYDGIFFYAVKTTRIFCRPSCKSRMPNRENVAVFHNGQEALDAGFHACKRCQPDQLQPPRTEWVEGVALLIEQRYAENWSLDDLSREVSVSPFHLQRSFTELKGCSPAEYLQSIRLQQAAGLLRETQKPVSEIGMDVGFLNPAYFATLFKKKNGQTPTAYRLQMYSSNEQAR